MIVGHIGAGASLPDTGDIQKSLRFAASRSTYMSRTPGVAGNRKTWTWSGWVKRGSLAAVRQWLLSAGVSSTDAGQFSFEFNTDHTFRVASGLTQFLVSSAVYRDVAAALHVVLAVNTSLATGGDRIILYVNGQRVTTSAYTAPTQNFDLAISSTSVHYLGCFGSGPSFYLDGYLSRVCFVDGAALTPDSFGYFNTEINEWVSKSQSAVKAVVDAGGTNSFMLDFDDGTSLTTLGYDKSVKGNNWTLNNHSLTAGVNYDWMDDTPTNNFAVLNSATNQTQYNHQSPKSTGGVIRSGNLSIVGQASNWNGFVGTISAPTDVGSWYWEINVAAEPLPDYNQSGIINLGGTTTYIVLSANFTVSDVLGFTFSNGTLGWYKNNVFQANLATGLSGDWLPYSVVANSNEVVYNFGQRPFAYAPPTGFKALCTKNLPAPSILNPKKHFDVVLATGANIKSTAEAVFPSNFLEWIKDRGNANNHQLIDTVRGTSAVLQSNTTAAETTYAAPSGSSVAWLWKAGGAPVTNNAGSIQSQVSANPQAGFSIVTYTGTGANATVGHGLGVAPKMVIVKRRNAVSDWCVYHSSIGATNRLLLSQVNASAADATVWLNTAPDSVKVTLGSSVGVNSVHDFVAYCFAEIPGFSKIGSYIGNGSADGPFVYCGFKPKYVLAKCSSATGNWTVLDAAREGYNVDNDPLYLNLSNAEGTTDLLDITSNGFKLRTTDASVNTNGATYIFYAIAAVPFNYANAR